MIHYMKLSLLPFQKIANGTKTIELRLNDEKRQKMNVGDTVIFRCAESKDIINANVKWLYKFADFETLYKTLNLFECGYNENELCSADFTDMQQYYSEEQIKKYGVLGIELCNISVICNVKDIITNSPVLELLIPSVYNPAPERLLNRANQYKQGDKTEIYAYSEEGEYKGIIVFENSNTAEILDIAVKSEYRGKNIGTKLIDFVFSQFNPRRIVVETDDDAIEFYKKYGFKITDTKIKFNTKRYICECNKKV